MTATGKILAGEADKGARKAPVFTMVIGENRGIECTADAGVGLVVFGPEKL